MKPIPFIQFHSPHGRRTEDVIDLEDDVYDKFVELSATGCRLTAEVLRTGVCSFCIESQSDQADYACEICPNGPQVPIVISKMILAFSIDEFNKWKAELNAD